MQPWIVALTGLYTVASIVSFGAMWFDKLAASGDRRRVPERRLHLLELLGGWPGSLIAQRALRHKNRKAQYQLAFWSIVALHAAGLVLLIATR